MKKRFFLLQLLLVVTIHYSCLPLRRTCYTHKADYDSLIVYFLPPQNHYLIDVTEETIKTISETKTSYSSDPKVIDDLLKRYVTDIQAKKREDYKSVDARIVLDFKGSKGDTVVLINKFGYFNTYGTVYEGGELEKSLLQHHFPQVLFMENL